MFFVLAGAYCGSDNVCAYKNMSNAELLDSRMMPGPDHDGHTIQIAHVRTDHGISTVRSEQPEAESSHFFIGGLFSGGSYELAACSAAHLGFAAHTVRHGSNSMHDALEADADEVVDIVELLGRNGPVHLNGHSKAGRVVLMAAARLSDEIKLASVTLYNPALHATNIFDAAKGVHGVLREQIAVNFAHPLRMAHAVRGTLHEIRHRPLGIAGETLELFRPYDFREDVQRIHDRGADTTLVIGKEDHLVNEAALQAEADRYGFGRVIIVDGAVEGSHFGIVAVKGFVPKYIPAVSTM